MPSKSIPRSPALPQRSNACFRASRSSSEIRPAIRRSVKPGGRALGETGCAQRLVVAHVEPRLSELLAPELDQPADRLVELQAARAAVRADPTEREQAPVLELANLLQLEPPGVELLVDLGHPLPDSLMAAKGRVRDRRVQHGVLVADPEPGLPVPLVPGLEEVADHLLSGLAHAGSITPRAASAG